MKRATWLWMAVVLAALAHGCGGTPSAQDGALDDGGSDATWDGLDGSAAADASVPPDGTLGNGPPPDPTFASTLLVNPAHTNSIDDSSLVPPLARRYRQVLWIVT